VEQREAESDEKYNIIKDIVKNKRVVAVDDSIVRGLTARKLVKKLKEAGAKEVHLRIFSPPIKFPCYLGIETKERRTLVAREGNMSLVRKRTNDPDSLEYLSYDGMFEAIGKPSSEFCTACLDGDYPVPIPDICG
jgi:amidophosphoribosyltransferase